jgi:hypothetical protein
LAGSIKADKQSSGPGTTHRSEVEGLLEGFGAAVLGIGAGIGGTGGAVSGVGALKEGVCRTLLGLGQGLQRSEPCGKGWDALGLAAPLKGGAGIGEGQAEGQGLSRQGILDSFSQQARMEAQARKPGHHQGGGSIGRHGLGWGRRGVVGQLALQVGHALELRRGHLLGGGPLGLRLRLGLL